MAALPGHLQWGSLQTQKVNVSPASLTTGLSMAQSSCILHQFHCFKTSSIITHFLAPTHPTPQPPKKSQNYQIVETN